MSFGLPDDFPFQLTKPLGHGSFASVYEGYDKKTKERRAIKIVDIKKLQQKSHYAESEMKIMMRLQARKHPSLVAMYKAQRINEDSMALVLEFCDKGDLASYVDDQPKKRLDEPLAKKLMQDLALGLQCLRSKNIIHRDLKPQNLLLKSHPRSGLILKIADFGFAKELSDYNEVLPSLVGSPMYLAPELWKKEGYTTQADLWSVGVILFEIIYGHYLYFARTIPELVKLVKTQAVEFPKTPSEDLPFEVSPECLDLMKGLLQKDPEERITWDKYLEHPWLDLETRKLVDSFCDLETDDDLINHYDSDPSRSLEQKPQQSSDNFDSPQSEEPAEPQQSEEPVEPESGISIVSEDSRLSVASMSLAVDYDPFAGKEEEDRVKLGGGKEVDPLEMVKALHQFANLLEKGEPEKSLSLYMEILTALKDLKTRLKSDLQRAKAQVIFQNAIKMADSLSKGLPSNTKVPPSSRVIHGLAIELNQKAEIDELFDAFAMAVEEYSLAALLVKYLLESKRGGEWEDAEGMKARVEKYERSARHALRKQEE